MDKDDTFIIANKIEDSMIDNGYVIESTGMYNGFEISAEECIEIIKAIRLTNVDDAINKIENISKYHLGSISRRREEKEMTCPDFDAKHCNCFLPNITKENCYCAIENMKKVSMRHTTEYKDWRDSVLKRDNNSCQKCGAKKHLHAHHIKHYSKYPEERYTVDNGLTLCSICHKKEHARKK